MNSRRGSILIIIVLIVVLAVVAGIYLLGKQGISIFPQVKPSTISSPAEAPTKEGNVTANWKTYRNEKYGFELKLPPVISTCSDKQDRLFPKEYNDKNGERIIVTEGPSCEDNFIIAILDNPNHLKPFDYWKNSFVTPGLSCNTGNTQCSRNVVFEKQNYKEVYTIEKFYPEKEGVLIKTEQCLGVCSGKLIYIPANSGKILYLTVSDTQINNQILSTFHFLK